MRVVVDTNVLVSAVLHDRIPQDVILFVAETLGFEWMASPEILVEYRDVLRRPKFGLPESIINAWFEFLSQSVTIVELNETIEFPRDRADAKFLACALFTDAEWLVTGDKDFEEAKKLVNTTILSAALFKKLVCEEWGI